MTDRHRIRLAVNGDQVEGEVEARRLLVDFLREDLTLVGTHVGCEQGVCGTCTVLLDGRSVRSCLMFAVQADGCEVLTVEGLARDGALHPLQQAFSDQQGLQCGYCTPGMLLRSLELLRDDPTPSRDRIREGIASQLCRCTGYQFIVDAVVQAAQDMAAEATHQRGPTPLPQEA